jgi:tetratricopeptide (TPR) repeat protein
LAALAAFFLCLSTGVPAQDTRTAGHALPRLGTVSFETSCAPELKGDFNRGVALLHSFWHDEAQRAFEAIAMADPQCAMAYWGLAMTHFHQLLDSPSSSDLAAAAQELARADAATETSPRESAYIRALHRFFEGYTREDYVVHAQHYSEAMGELTTAYPQDLEGKIFYALSLLAAESVDLTNSKKAVAILAPLLREHPDHPGIAHYIIHACDHPQMAREGLDAARRYAMIAPAAPHALHMPSHIFTRLGLWQDDIASNLASKAAAENPESGMHEGAEARLHAMEFLEYAYLQIGHDEEARAIWSEAKTIRQSEVDPRYPGYYATVQARFPAVFAIETRDWAMAGALEPASNTGPASQAVTWLARAEAAAHLKDSGAASAAAAGIDAALAKDRPPQAGSAMAIARDEIHAWVAFSQGDLTRAASLLRPIADRQAAIGKGEVELPAREMLADMLLLSGNATGALSQYERSLQTDPNRFNALLGAARAAEEAHRSQLAARYYRTLLANCPKASGAALAELAHVRAVLETHSP